MTSFPDAVPPRADAPKKTQECAGMVASALLRVALNHHHALDLSLYPFIAPSKNLSTTKSSVLEKTGNDAHRGSVNPTLFGSFTGIACTSCRTGQTVLWSETRQVEDSIFSTRSASDSDALGSVPRPEEGGIVR
jgi:hypothetical protein